MDPNATLEAIRAADKAGDWAEAAKQMVNLAEWVERGGFLPAELAEEDPAEVARYFRGLAIVGRAAGKYRALTGRNPA